MSRCFCITISATQTQLHILCHRGLWSENSSSIYCFSIINVGCINVQEQGSQYPSGDKIQQNEISSSRHYQHLPHSGEIAHLNTVKISQKQRNGIQDAMSGRYPNALDQNAC
jgi:hypothetical protein